MPAHAQAVFRGEPIVEGRHGYEKSDHQTLPHLASQSETLRNTVIHPSGVKGLGVGYLADSERSAKMGEELDGSSKS